MAAQQARKRPEGLGDLWRAYWLPYVLSVTAVALLLALCAQPTPARGARAVTVRSQLNTPLHVLQPCGSTSTPLNFEEWTPVEQTAYIAKFRARAPEAQGPGMVKLAVAADGETVVLPADNAWHDYEVVFEVPPRSQEVLLRVSVYVQGVPCSAGKVSGGSALEVRGLTVYSVP